MKMQTNEKSTNLDGEIIIFQTPDGQTSIDVQMQDETVWLTSNQMSVLFGRDEKTIRKHINNVFSEGELSKSNNTHFLRVDGVKQLVAFYNLDVIISVGYRVKSQRGTQFRIWANRILKEYLLKGYSINHRLNEMENRVDRRLTRTELEVERLNEKMDFYIHSSLPKQQGIFFDGEVFDAHSFVCDLIKEAKERIVLIDNYLDNTVLTRLAYRKEGLPVTIYTKTASNQLLLDIKQHNAQYPGVELRITNKAHDRFLIIDNRIYHLGASIKDLGKKIFAFSLMEEDASELLKRLEE